MNRIEHNLCGEIIKQDLIEKETLDKAIQSAKNEKTSILVFLRNNKFIPEDKLLALLSEILSVSYVSLIGLIIENKVIGAVPVRVAWHYEFLPVSLAGNMLTVAVSEPLSVRAKDDIRLNLGYEIKSVLAKRDQILELLKKHYGIAADTVDRMIGGQQAASGSESTISYGKIENIEDIADDASVARLVNQIILEAYKKRSTDIHIEPYRGKLRLRYRIDGKLCEQTVPEEFSRFFSPILSRIKIMANLNIVERRIPQDGRAIVRIQDQVLDLRVSFMPTPHGESVVVRILPAKKQWDLHTLGLMEEDVEKFETLLKTPSGIMFVTGPTGAGKTTTLYSCVERINTADRKIVTIEDPIEYEIENIIQVQVNPDVGLTFAAGLRSMLRHDPDVMMVGEVRDKETAQIAIRVALTGHFVLSTLHTNDAVSGITRLVDIGIKPYLIASTVRAFVAQRLVRVICPSCKTECNDVGDELKERISLILGKGNTNDITLYKGAGCEKCNFSGYYGRTAIYETLLIDNDIQMMITNGRSEEEIKKAAIRNGMKPIMHGGLVKVANGITTAEEVMSVCRDIDPIVENDIRTDSLDELCRQGEREYLGVE